MKNIDNKVIIIDDKNNIIVNIGTIDLQKGSIDIIIPQYVSAEILNIIADPVYPDIDTLEDNIIRIKSINVMESI